MAANELRVLILDDSADDAELEIAQLEREGYLCKWVRADTRESFQAALDSAEYDLVISDYSLPGFDGNAALRLFLERNLLIPFILISGTVGEEIAIESLKAGATDYVVKSHLWRLGPVVARALAEKEEHRQRRKTQQVLRFTQFSIDHAADAAFWIASDARFIYVNDAASRSLGYSRDELLSMTLHDIDTYFSPDVWPIRWETTRHGGSFTFESRHRTKDGRIFPVEITSNYLEFEGRGYICAFARDITERKQAEEDQIERVRIAALRADIGVALNKSDALGSILQSCAEAIVRHLNAACARIWTLSETENVLELQASAGVYTKINGSHGRVPVGELQIGRIAQTREAHLTNKISNNQWNSEWADSEDIVAFAGQPLIVEDRLVGVVAVLSRQPLGETTLGTLGSVTDVIAQCIERKRAEEAMGQAEARYRDLFENANDIIYTHDLDGNFTSVNKLGEKLMGYQAHEFVRMNIAKITAPEYLDDIRKKLENGGVSQAESTMRELEIVCSDGRSLPVEVSTRLIYEADKPAGVQVIARDISERKLAESERRRLEEELLQAQKMESIGRLAGGIAHDFNNLLTSIIGNAQLALRRLQPSDQPYSNLVEIEKAATRAGGLTRQLLAFGRRQRLDRRIININDTITDFTQMLRRIIGEDIEVRLETGVNLPHVFADPAQIEQAVMNLAVNSRDAMPMGGCISIQTTAVTLDAAFCREHAWAKPGRYVEVAVADTGQGMDPETQQRIFEPFFTTKEMGKGTGLGLAVVYGIVKQHEGAVAVESKPGQGTTFRMFLPIVETAEYAEARELAAPLRGGAETILVAEDEEALRKLVGDVLGKLGYHVLLARNGEEAIHLYKSNHKTIKLAILDLVMPKMGGRETAERIRKGGNNIPVIFVTGYSAEAARGQFGVNGTTLIQKPYSIDELGRRVREMLDERKQPITAGSSV